MGSMLYDIIKYQASTEGFKGGGKLYGIKYKINTIKRRFHTIFAFWSERVIYQDNEVDFVIFVHEEKLTPLTDYFNSLLLNKIKKSQEEVVVESFRKVFHVIIRTVAWIMRFNSDIRNFVQLTLSNTFYRNKEKK